MLFLSMVFGTELEFLLQRETGSEHEPAAFGIFNLWVNVKKLRAGIAPLQLQGHRFRRQ